MDLQSIISRCKKKDREAEKQLFLRFAPILMTDCRRFARDDHEARDFHQESWIHIFDKVKSYDLSRVATFQGWIRVVNRNFILGILRKRAKEIQTTSLDYLEDTLADDSPSIEHTNTEALIHAIQQLPEGYRTILNLYVYEGLNHSEIANKLQISSGTSRSQYSRAKQLLSKLLTNKNIPCYE